MTTPPGPNLCRAGDRPFRCVYSRPLSGQIHGFVSAGRCPFHSEAAKADTSILSTMLHSSPSYLVMPFMGTDLGKLMKLQRLSEEKIQYLVYQMLKGLKVGKSDSRSSTILT